MGFKKDGELVALSCDLYDNAGNTLDLSASVRTLPSHLLSPSKALRPEIRSMGGWRWLPVNFISLRAFRSCRILSSGSRSQDLRSQLYEAAPITGDGPCAVALPQLLPHSERTRGWPHLQDQYLLQHGLPRLWRAPGGPRLTLSHFIAMILTPK